MSDLKTKTPSAPTMPLPLPPQLRPWRAFVLLLTGLLLLGSAWGQEQEKEEEELTYVSPYNPVNEYLDAIDRIEADYGPYSTELSDLYLGLGQTLVNRGEYERARDAFHRGVLVVRVNSGPNSPEQTNHLYLLANIETTLGESDTADKILHNIYFINSEFHGEDSPEMLPVLERIYNWYQVTRPLGTSLAEYSDYAKTVELSKEMVRISELAYGQTHPKTVAAFRRLADAQFMTARFLENQQLEIYKTMQVSANDYYEAGHRTFRKHLEVLQESETVTPLRYAEALADLGDWYLVFHKPAHSRHLYQKGYEILTESDQPAEVIENFMSQPRPLHFITSVQLVLPPEDEAQVLEDLNLDVSMTVTIYGEIREVEVVKAPRDLSEEELEQIRQQVSRIRFRPAMKEGEIVTTREFIRQYDIAMSLAS